MVDDKDDVEKIKVWPCIMMLVVLLLLIVSILGLLSLRGEVIKNPICSDICVSNGLEYYDYKSGLDLITARTPFSGGSGKIPANLKLAKYALAVALISLFLTMIIGLVFIFIRGIGLLPIGILGLLMLFGYTQWMVHNAFLCLIRYRY